LDRSEKSERLREFSDELDQDQSGGLDIKEVSDFLACDHLAHILGDAYQLLTACDENQDHEASLEEFEACRALSDSRHFRYHASMSKDADELFRELANGIKHRFAGKDEL
jgi:hypothetical protein